MPTGKQGKRIMRLHLSVVVLAIVLISIAAGPLRAQDDTEREVEKYRQMLKGDPWSNPGLLDVDRGEALWKAKRGPNNVSLEGCDLGKGPGVVEGAFAELPRYFPDAGRVMDAEARLVWCIEKLQGFPRADIIKRPYSKANQRGSDLEALATYVAHKSNGWKFAPSLQHAQEREALAVGEALFHRRQGPMDFSCATCHADSGKRIRLQSLPVLGKPEEARNVIGEWPAYRVSQGTVMTMQHRIADCYWQMRLPLIDYGSDVTVALTMFLVNQAKGGEITAPQIKR
jgi:sulfur-oxidizing protein SoxA